MELTKRCKTCQCASCRWQGTDNCPYQYCWKCDGNEPACWEYGARASWRKYHEKKGAKASDA